MKKIFISVFFYICFFNIFAATPKKYLEQKYGNKAIYFSEDIDDWLDNNKANSKSPLYFFNSTDHEITFEFHELQTKFGNVTSDKIYPIKGRTSKITIKSNQYIDTLITMDDIEHLAFIFNEGNKYEIFAYIDRLEMLEEQKISGEFVYGSGGVSSKTVRSYSIIFEITDKR